MAKLPFLFFRELLNVLMNKDFGLFIQCMKKNQILTYKVGVTQVTAIENFKRYDIQAAQQIQQHSVHFDLFANDKAKGKYNPLCIVSFWKAQAVSEKILASGIFVFHWKLKLLCSEADERAF